MNKFVEELMGVAHDKTQSIYQQRHEFDRLVSMIIQDAREKFEAQVKSEQQKQADYELNFPRL